MISLFLERDENEVEDLRQVKEYQESSETGKERLGIKRRTAVGLSGLREIGQPI